MSSLFKLKNGTNFLLTEAPGGIYNSVQLKKIASLCEDDLAIVKATEDQRLGLFVTDEKMDEVAQALGECGLGVRNYREGLHQAVSCLGELCPEHEQDALGTSMDLAQKLEDLKSKTPLRIGINGCQQCCTPCHTLDISVVGDLSGYNINLGGKNSQVPEMAAFMAEQVPPDQVGDLLLKVINLFNEKVEEDESLHDVLERCGVSEFVAALSPYSQDAHHGDDVISEVSDKGGEELDSEDAEIAEEGDHLEDSLSSDDNEENEVSSLENNNEIRGDDVNEQEQGSSLDLDESELEMDDIDVDLDDVEADLNESEDELTDTLDEDIDVKPLSEDDSNDMEEVSIEVASESPEIDEISLDHEENVDLGDDEDIELGLEDESKDDISDDVSIDEIGEIDDAPSPEESSREEDFDETEKDQPPVEDDASSDVELEAQDSSDDEEHIESKIIADIDEESEVLAVVSPSDDNYDDRESTLELLNDEHASDDELEVDMEPDEELGAYEEDKENAIEQTPSTEPASSSPASLGLAPKEKNGDHQGQFSFNGFSVADGIMHLSFDSGAFIDLDISKLADNKTINLGGQTCSISRVESGIELEVDGMKLFYPFQKLSVAS